MPTHLLRWGRRPISREEPQVSLDRGHRVSKGRRGERGTVQVGTARRPAGPGGTHWVVGPGRRAAGQARPCSSSFSSLRLRLLPFCRQRGRRVLAGSPRGVGARPGLLIMPVECVGRQREGAAPVGDCPRPHLFLRAARVSKGAVLRGTGRCPPSATDGRRWARLGFSVGLLFSGRPSAGWAPRGQAGCRHPPWVLRT